MRIEKLQAKMQEAAEAIDAIDAIDATMGPDDEDSRINPPNTPAFQRNSTNSLAMGVAEAMLQCNNRHIFILESVRG